MQAYGSAAFTVLPKIYSHLKPLIFSMDYWTGANKFEAHFLIQCYLWCHTATQSIEQPCKLYK
jgi:hypothetical protein